MKRTIVKVKINSDICEMLEQHERSQEDDHQGDEL
jgi:hypothetical protein